MGPRTEDIPAMYYLMDGDLLNFDEANLKEKLRKIMNTQNLLTVFTLLTN